MAIAEPAQFTTEKHERAYRPVVFVHFDEPSKYWASRFIDVSGECATPANWSDGAGADYEGFLSVNGVGGISQSVARFGGLATLGGVTVSLINMGYAAFLASNPYLEGQQISIYLVFDDGTPLVFAESLAVFTGLVETFGIDPATITITLSPPELTGELILSDHEPLGLSNYGHWNNYTPRLFPVVYGDHTFRRNCVDPAEDMVFDPANNMVRLQLIGYFLQESINRGVYYFAVSDAAIVDTANLGDIWIKDPVTSRFYNLDKDTIYYMAFSSSPSGGDILTIYVDDPGGLLTVKDYLYPESVSEIGGVTPFDDYADMGDQDMATEAFVSEVLGAGAFSYGNTLEFVTPPYGDDWTILESQVWANCRSVGDFHGAINLQTMSGADPDAFEQYGTTADPDTDVVVTLADIASGGETLDDYIVEIIKIIVMQIDNALFDLSGFEFYAGVRGIPDDGSGTYTSTPDALIENPVHILHHLSINYFGKSSGELDTSITDPTGDAAALRSGWDFSAALTESEPYRDLVQRLSQAAMCYTWINNVNKLKIRAIRPASNETYPVSGTTTPAAGDINSDSPAGSASAYTNRWIERVTHFAKTRIQDHANEITLSYFADADGELQATLTDDDADSITAYGRTIEGTVENTLIRDAATAAAFLALYLELSAYRTWYTESQGRLDAVNLEPGDLVSLDCTFDDMLSAEDRIWQVLEIRKQLTDGVGRINIKAVERLIL